MFQFTYKSPFQGLDHLEPWICCFYKSWIMTLHDPPPPKRCFANSRWRPCRKRSADCGLSWRCPGFLIFMDFPWYINGGSLYIYICIYIYMYIIHLWYFWRVALCIYHPFEMVGFSMLNIMKSSGDQGVPPWRRGKLRSDVLWKINGMRREENEPEDMVHQMVVLRLQTNFL